jgi:hypothetical protein
LVIFCAAENFIFRAARQAAMAEVTPRNARLAPRLTLWAAATHRGPDAATGENNMKRDPGLAVALGLVVAIGTGVPAFAESANSDIRQDQRDIRGDQKDIHKDQKTIKSQERDIRRDQQAERQDLREGDSAGAAAQQKDILQDQKTLNSERQDLQNDRGDVRQDRRDIHQDRQND